MVIAQIFQHFALPCHATLECADATACSSLGSAAEQGRVTTEPGNM